ncbi:MAG: hypothetical protein WBW33_37200, partial [Bryobacteraceae bacterium]
MIDLERLLRRAAPLAASPANTFLNRDAGEEDGSAAKRLSRWRNNAAENSSEAFADRLDWEGLTPETVESVLGDERPLHPGDDLWAPAARRIVQHLTESGATSQDDSGPVPSDHSGRLPGSGVPFGPILAPLV